MKTLSSKKASAAFSQAIEKQQIRNIQIKAVPIANAVTKAADQVKAARKAAKKAEKRLKKLQKALDKFHKTGNEKHLEVFGV